MTVLGKATAFLRQHMSSILDLGGLGLISTAVGMWEVPAGLAAAGVSCLLLSWRNQ